MLTSSYPPQLNQAMRDHPFALVFATISGAHLYGFASVDSHWDIRGVHVLLLREVLGLEATRETVEFSHVPSPTRLAVPLEVELDLDLVTHDLRKFAGLLLKHNGYALEQVLSPLVIFSTPQHEALRDLARQCVTRYHGQQYLSVSVNQWRTLQKELETGQPPRLKLLLYAFRTVLSGIHLMQTGEIETNLVTLNASARLPYINDLLAQKVNGLEEETLAGARLVSSLSTPLEFYYAEHQRLLAQLHGDMQTSKLPPEVRPNVRAALNNWVIDTRLQLGQERVKQWRW